MTVNEINVLLEELIGDVNVSFTNSLKTREIANIQSDIIMKDGDVQKQIIDSEIEYASLMITQASSLMILNNKQTNVTIGGQASQNVTLGEQILG